MVSYDASDPQVLAAIRAQADAILQHDLAMGRVQTKGGTFALGRGHVAGSVAGVTHEFDLDAYRRAVESGASGSAQRDAALGALGQKQLYRTQPQVAELITRLQNKQSVSDLEVSNARANTSIIKSGHDIRNAVIDNSHDPASVVSDFHADSGQGLINQRTFNIAPVAHPLYERQAVDDIVSNTQSPMATPDEQVLPNTPSNQMSSFADTTPSQPIYDGEVDLNTLEPSDSSGSDYSGYVNNNQDTVSHLSGEAILDSNGDQIGEYDSNGIPQYY